MNATSGFDPLALMVMSNAVSMIAEEMGVVLERGALSPNIRERRDASSALFDARGRMVAQAAHIPVHLGAMPESVRAVMAHSPEPGDVFLLNDPYAGGSHLPDLTMVEAIGDGGTIVGFAAVRAHHADVGGLSPGSMPQGATELFQEGIIVPPVRIARRGLPVDDVLRFEQELLDHLRRNSSVLQNIRETKRFDDDTAQAVREQIAEFKKGFQTSSGKLLAGREEHDALGEDEVEQEQIVKQKRG